LSAVDTGNTSWTVLASGAGGTVSASGTRITDKTGFASGTWLSGGAFGTAVTWSTVHAWVTWGASWTVETLFTGSASLTGGTSLTWLTVFTWVTVSSVWTGDTSATWFTDWTASGTVWTGWTWSTSGTGATDGTSWTLSTVWSDIRRGESIFTVGTSITWGAGGTVHTGSTVGTWLTLSTWNTGGTWNTWWTHWTHWTFLLFTLAFASSGSASLGWGFAGTLVVDLAKASRVVVVFVFSADSVSGGDVSLEEVEVWAAREASLLFSTLWGDGVDHNIDLVLSEVEGSFLDGSERSLLDNTRVGHDHEHSSSVFVSVSEVFEHTEGGVETLGDVVTMSHVLSIGDSSEETSFLASIFETGNHNGFGGVSNNTDSNSTLVFSEKIFNHSGGSDFHFWPVSFDTGGGVQKNNDFNWAWYFWNGGNVTAASAGTFGQVHTTGGSDGSDLVVGVLLGDDQGRGERDESSKKPHVSNHREL